MGAVAGGVRIALSGDVGTDHVDRLGHGTAVFAAIFAVRVFGDRTADERAPSWPRSPKLKSAGAGSDKLDSGVREPDHIEDRVHLRPRLGRQEA